MEEDDAYGRAIRIDAAPSVITLDAQGRVTKAGGERISRVDTIRYTGILYWKGQPITWGRPAPLLSTPGCDPREDPTFLARYFIGAWQEQMPIMPRNAPKMVRAFIEQARSTVTIVPKPIGIAILLAVLAFPWRGDAYKDSAPEYREQLGKAADAFVAEAQKRRTERRTPGRPKKFHTFLERACRVLDDSSIPFNFRRTIAAEYVVIWADSICQDFTHYARLAAFDVWGEPGGRSPSAPSAAIIHAIPGETTTATVSFPSIFSQLPQIRKAMLPQIKTLTT